MDNSHFLSYDLRYARPFEKLRSRCLHLVAHWAINMVHQLLLVLLSMSYYRYRIQPLSLGGGSGCGSGRMKCSLPETYMRYGLCQYLYDIHTFA